MKDRHMGGGADAGTGWGCVGAGKGEPAVRGPCGTVAAGRRCLWAATPKAVRPGNVELPESGPTWQAMRLSRNRNFGQPEMIAFLQDLSVAATQVGLEGSVHR